MNESWPFKKLGDICDSELGKTLNQSKDSGILRPYLCSINILWDFIDTTILKKARFNSYEVDRYSVREGDLLICEGGDIGRAAIWHGEEIPYQNALHRIRFRDKKYSPRFYLLFLRYLKKKNILDTKYGKGVTIKHLVKSSLLSIPVPTPPIEEQERIVAELDLLTGIIDKQRAQLRELDTLARSIFYDMFGDPVENEKQWKKQRLEDYCEVSSSKRVLVKDVVNSGIPFLRGTELTALNKASSSEDVNFSMFITPEHYKKVKTITGVPKKGDILIPSINSEGITWIVDTDEPFYFKDGRVLWIHMNTKTFSSEYLKFAISGILKSTYDTLTSGATFLELKLFIIRDLPIPIPPLNLQQSFARKIASIESQKSTITRSIAETQKLFDYTMDKYFG